MGREVNGAAKLAAFITDYPHLSSGRFDLCRAFWLSTPATQRVRLFLRVLRAYRTCHRADVAESFALAELTSAFYELGFPVRLEDSLAILRTAFHTCGHGSDVRPPLDIALAYYVDKPFTEGLFEALRIYRASLSKSRSLIAQKVKGRIDLILWQDFEDQWKPSACWTERVRCEIRAMDARRAEPWRALFKTFPYCRTIEPPSSWTESARPVLSSLTHMEFSNRVRFWLSHPAGQAPIRLTPAGSHMLKGLIWCALNVEDTCLGRELLALAELPWANRQSAEKVAGTIAYLWKSRGTREAARLLEPIAKRYGYPGGKIEQYYRDARSLAG